MRTAKQQQRRSNAGRPQLPEGEGKSRIVPVRVDPEDWKLISDAAKAAGGSISDWIRTTVRNAAEHAIYHRTLHDAMRIVLRRHKGGMATTSEIASDIAAESLYQRGDGTSPRKKQIAARARKYPHLFELVSSQQIRLVQEETE